MKKYLLVEGITDVAFVKYICYKNGVTNKFNDFSQDKNQYVYDNLIIIDLKGQDKLEQELIYLKDEEIQIEQIAIIQDADKDFKKSEESIKVSIKNSNIDKNKIKIFLTPNNKDLGDLETLLLSTIDKNNILECYNDYEICLQKEHDIYEKALNKGKVHAYTMYSQQGENLHKPQDSFISKKGKDTKLWDLNRDEFKPIVEFILNAYMSNNKGII